MVADAQTVAAINERIAAGQLKNRAGKPVSERIDAALWREDGKYLYVIRGDIPVMLMDEAVPAPPGLTPRAQGK